MRDKAEKGRAVTAGKLTPEQVVELRALYGQSISSTVLAPMFGVGVAQVIRIVTNKSRRLANPADLPEPTWRAAGRGRPQELLTNSDVRALREAYATGDFSQRYLAIEYGIGQAHVSYLVTGRERSAAGGPLAVVDKSKRRRRGC